MIEKKMSLIKSEDLDFLRKQLKHLNDKLKLTSTLSPGLYQYMCLL